MREEYPRPDFVRNEWMNLNGSWDFIYGNDKTKIEVPFVCQSEKSGVNKRITEDHVTYERRFCVPEKWKGKEILLNFGAVDYQCRVYINNSCIGSHIGGQTTFSFPIAEYLTWAEETIRVEIEDPLKDEMIPRGKQFWEEESSFIWYTPSTGIWQTVWLEPVSETCLKWVHFTSDIDEGTVRIDYQLTETSILPCRVHLLITLGEEEIFHGNMLCNTARNSLTVDIFRKKAMEGSFHFMGNYWSPENPVLYHVFIQVEEGDSGIRADVVESYFGMRKIHVEDGKLYLNNQPYYQKLVLDQGYWKEGLITAPDDQEYCNDILKAKAMGFNGCRKHEKVEDPRFLYWADKLGFLVWEGMASFWSYTPQAAAAFTREWLEVIERDYNHPSVVVWGLLNESWGVPQIYANKQQQSFAQSLYYLAHGLDSTRLVISNDGWEMTESDICAIHSYKHGDIDDKKQHQLFAECLRKVDGLPFIMEKHPYAKGFSYSGQPIVLTECGGIRIKKEKTEEITGEKAMRAGGQDWGYTSVPDTDFLKEYERVIHAIYDSDLINGFCYTQLTDVEQESNGLLTRDHQYKFKPEDIRKINDRKR
ncbi:glycoside hydrolase family 2 protein [Lacrimispora indolis]|uniref:glycoside hydrolase family 2 protein n=1 Tax=Lacrimispora indolis TaxID=69825 RepID=UPI00045E96A6|nr:sugar-binding domain-containing protein [Lacrimispora indolis]